MHTVEERGLHALAGRGDIVGDDKPGSMELALAAVVAAVVLPVVAVGATVVYFVRRSKK